MPDEDHLLALPLALPMGWTQSPPMFSAVTETIADVANARLRHHYLTRPHHLNKLASTQPPTNAPADPFLPPTHTTTLPPTTNPLLSLHRRCLNVVDVFVDDFIGVAQGTPRQLNHVRRVLMTAINNVFRPLHPDDPTHRTEPISVKKLQTGDASWLTCKKILGWIINS